MNASTLTRPRSTIRPARLLLALALLLCVLAHLGAAPSSALAAGPTCTVAASGGTYTTIQAAVNDTGCDRINVAAGTYTENVTINRSVTINGSTTGSTIVDGNRAGSVFRIPSGTVSLANLTIQHGSGYNNGYSTLGGGILTIATLTVINSTISDNSADQGAGIYNNGGTLTMTNSTVSGNSAVWYGGGIYVGTAATVRNSTISGNSGSPGGGIYNRGTTTLQNTIVANSPAGGNCSGPITDGGGNLSYPDARCPGMNADPKLGALADNGGTTRTRALLPGSPAIDAGSATDCPDADQRGVTRPQGDGCDIGAYEAIATDPPLLNVSFTPNGQNGWFTTDPATGSVTAQGLASITGITCQGATVSNPVGIGTASASATLTVTGAEQHTVTCSATDSAGHTGAGAGSQNTATVKIDTTAPDTTITAQPSTPATSSTATFSFSSSEAGSTFQCSLDGAAFAACASPRRYSGLADGSHTFQVRALDVARNADATPANATWTIDTVAPTANPSSSPAATSAGWNTGNVTVSWNWSDSGSGLNTSTCPASSTSSGDGTIPLTASCTDTAGNTGSASYTVKVDTTAPTITAAATKADGTPYTAGSWTNQSVTVHFSCSDTGSGIPAGACPADQVLKTDGTAVASSAQTVTDAAGNTSAASNVVTVKIDMTAPTLTPVVSPNPVLLRGSATTSPNASDATSGVASQSCGAVDTSSVGMKTVPCTATDAAGNTSSANASYQVIYNWTGFFQPIDAAPTVNVVKAGSAVPVKFSLMGNQGLTIFAAQSPSSKQISCDSGAPADEIEQTVTAGASSLTYDAASDTYTYVWKTDKAWTNTCRQLSVTLNDGTVHTANFRFK